MKNLIILLIPLLLAGCLDNSPSFLEPQPTGSKNLKAFPKKLIGDYSINEGENLSISKYMITQWGFENINMPLSDVDSSKELVIKNDTLYDIEEGDNIPIQIRNDSLFGVVNWMDTAFFISDIHIIRKCKGFYILNEYTKDSVWKVVRMHYNKSDGLEFAIIDKKNEAKDLKNFTTLIDQVFKNDTIVDYKLKPTKEEFKKMLLSDKIFTDKEKYRKK